MSHILLVELGPGAPELAERLVGVDVVPVRASGVDEAVAILKRREPLITAVLLPSELPEKEIKAAVKQLRSVGPASGLSVMAYGRTPEARVRKRLRAAGVELALWQPIDDGMLRFQINRAVTGDRDEHGRLDQRVPTYLFARVSVGGRVKDAIVYSLSSGGAFLETPRASMDGAMLDVEIRIPGDPVQVKALVIFSNVPGNLQRPNLPLGMGVRFEDLTDDGQKRIQNYVEHRLSQLEV